MVPDHSGRQGATLELLYRSGGHRDQKFKFPRWGSGRGTWKSTLLWSYLMKGSELEALQYTVSLRTMSFIFWYLWELWS